MGVLKIYPPYTVRTYNELDSLVEPSCPWISVEKNACSLVPVFGSTFIQREGKNRTFDLIKSLTVFGFSGQQKIPGLGPPVSFKGCQGTDGKKIENIYDYTYAIEALKIGEEVVIVVLRGDERVTLKVTPGSRE